MKGEFPFMVRPYITVPIIFYRIHYIYICLGWIASYSKWQTYVLLRWNVDRFSSHFNSCPLCLPVSSAASTCLRLQLIIIFKNVFGFFPVRIQMTNTTKFIASINSTRLYELYGQTIQLQRCWKLPFIRNGTRASAL